MPTESQNQELKTWHPSEQDYVDCYQKHLKAEQHFYSDYRGRLYPIKQTSNAY